jgi:hypothetical protein
MNSPNIIFTNYTAFTNLMQELSQVKHIFSITLKISRRWLHADLL